MSARSRATRWHPRGEEAPATEQPVPDHAHHRSRRPPAPRGGEIRAELTPTLGRVDTAVTDPVVGLVLEGRYRLEERLAPGRLAAVFPAPHPPPPQEGARQGVAPHP